LVVGGCYVGYIWGWGGGGRVFLKLGSIVILELYYLGLFGDWDYLEEDGLRRWKRLREGVWG
jgi:hypothetical protein